MEAKKKRLNLRHIGSTPGFTAPELFDLNEMSYLSYRNSFAVDVYGAGMTVLSFLVKCTVFLDLDWKNLKRSDEIVAIKAQVSKERIESFLRKHWSASELDELNKLSLIDLVYQCIDFNPQTRITSSQALQMLKNTNSTIATIQK